MRTSGRLHRASAALAMCAYLCLSALCATSVFAQDAPGQRQDTQSQDIPIKDEAAPDKAAETEEKPEVEEMFTPQPSTKSPKPISAAVVINGKPLFIFYTNFDGRTPAERAERTTKVLDVLMDRGKLIPSTLKMRETTYGAEILADDSLIAILTPADARIAHSTTALMASEAIGKIRDLARQKNSATTAQDVAVGIGFSVAATIVLLLLCVVSTKGASALCARINAWQGGKIQSIKIQNAELLSAEMVAQVMLTATKFASIAVVFCLFCAWLIVVLSSFPATREFANSLVTQGMSPLSLLVTAILDYLPKGLIIVFIATLTWALMAFARFFFTAVGDKLITFADFDPEWADPTYKLVRLLFIAFGLVVALPYLPGWESESFKQVGLFLGILLSLGSTSVVGNVMAGTVLTYTNAFKVGDRIKIGECTGDVVQKSMFVTRVVTPKNETVSLPNGVILNSNVINYSALARAGQLILHTSVTIGYDAEWRQIHKLLIDAALATEGIEQAPPPFVLQTSLDDFFVSYELNAYTKEANAIPRIYSGLHQNIQDKFNDAGVEIMSPHYSSHRDGNIIAIPEKYRSKDYKAPSFRFSGGLTGDTVDSTSQTDS